MQLLSCVLSFLFSPRLETQWYLSSVFSLNLTGIVGAMSRTPVSTTSPSFIPPVADVFTNDRSIRPVRPCSRFPLTSKHRWAGLGGCRSRPIRAYRPRAALSIDGLCLPDAARAFLVS
ncbi:hypothetical protein B0H10DRAFT_2105098, partial [Mycena sp. CBHHK59/15]